MDDPQRFPRYVGQTLLLSHEPRENAGAAFGGFVEQKAVAHIARGHRLGKDLALLELVRRLDAAQDRMLNGDLRNIGKSVDGTKEKRILVVLNAGDDPLQGRGRGVKGALVRVVVLAPGPVAGYRIDAEAVNRLVGSAARPFVQARNRCPGAVCHSHDLALLVEGRPVQHIDFPVADCPLERRLQFKALTLALFVVGRDLLGRLRGDVLDPIRVAHDLGVAERRPAGVAHREIVVEVPCAAGRADSHGVGGQLRVGSRRPLVTGREQDAHNPVCAPLVIDEAARAELGQRKEPRSLEISRPPSAVPSRRDVREERQPWEVVPRKEALCGKVAVRVEVAGVRIRPALEQFELIQRLRMPRLRRPFVAQSRRVVVDGFPRRIPLPLGGGKEVAPSIERHVEALGRRVYDGIGKGVPSRVPRRQLGCELVFDQVEDAPDPLAGVVGDAWRPQHILNLRTKGTSGVVENEQIRDAGVERMVDAREPDRVEMAGDQVPVRKLQDWRAHFAVDHRLGIAEEVLVVRALGRCVGNDKGGLSAATRPSSPLGVVRRRRRNVAHVDRVQRRDVDAELHRRGTKENRQEPIGLAGISEPLLGRRCRKLAAFPLAEAEALFPDLAVVGMNLGGVLARFEPEERMHRGTEHLGEILVKVAEEGVPLGTVAGGFAAQSEFDARVVDAPARQAERGSLLGHEAVRRRSAEKIIDKSIEVLRFQVVDRRAAAPQLLGAQGPAETAARAAAHDQMPVAQRARLAGGRADHQPARSLGFLVNAESPRRTKSAARLRDQLLKKGGIKHLAAYRHPLAHVVEQLAIDR